MADLDQLVEMVAGFVRTYSKSDKLGSDQPLSVVDCTAIINQALQEIGDGLQALSPEQAYNFLRNLTRIKDIIENNDVGESLALTPRQRNILRRIDEPSLEAADNALTSLMSSLASFIKGHKGMDESNFHTYLNKIADFFEQIDVDAVPFDTAVTLSRDISRFEGIISTRYNLRLDEYLDPDKCNDLELMAVDHYEGRRRPKWLVAQLEL